MPPLKEYQFIHINNNSTLIIDAYDLEQAIEILNATVKHSDDWEIID